jgi:hypothetical protein
VAPRAWFEALLDDGQGRRVWQAGRVTDPSPSSSASPSAERPRTAERPGALLAAVGVAVVEAVALLVYAVSLAVAAFQNPGSISAGPVVVAIFAIFALGVGLCARGLWRRSRAARTPFGVVQLFGLVTGYTLVQGDGTPTHVAGWAVLTVSVVGIALVMSPGVGAALD